MIRVKSRSELQPTDGKPPVPVQEPAAAPNQVLEAITQQSQQVAHLMAVLVERQAKPERLDAEIIRDVKTGKMSRVIITPVYK